jgi:hypothetical protein
VERRRNTREGDGRGGEIRRNGKQKGKKYGNKGGRWISRRGDIR